jgi:hypothetical protein
MLLTYLMLFVALCLSAVAAFYSIIGLTAIFAAAVWPIVIMGTILEAAKLVVTVWLHEYWREVKLTMKIYLVPAVFTLMVITSMGIFGFLSKAHLDQTVPTGDVQAQVALIDEKITNERDTIANARTLLGQLDKAVTDISNSADQEIKLRDGTTQIRSSAERALQVRRQQARDRATLTKTIEEAQARIVKLQEEKAPFAKELRKVEAEVGPIKYIAALIYGDNPDANLLEKAVRWVIIILVIVFDPLAIMMLLAATESYRWERERRKAAVPVIPDPVPEPEPEPDPGSEPESAVLGPKPDNPVEYQILDDVSEPDYVEPSAPQLTSDQPLQADNQDLSTDDDDHDQDADDPYKEAKRIWKEQNPDSTLKEQRRLLSIGRIDHLPWEDILVDDHIVNEFGFGHQFPYSPTKGDRFVRTDVLPTRLYKYNGDDWILVDKTLTDTYAHDRRYIDFLIEKISRGEYDPELLTDSERAEIESRLRTDL